MEAEMTPARRGAALLERARPGSVASLDPVRLDMRSETDCVLGQVYGSYFEGCMAVFTSSVTVFFARDDLEAAHGFTLYGACDLSLRWQELRSEWLSLITEYKEKA
jgi:hypothetical protein